MSSVETAPETLHGARRLLMQMCVWLAVDKSEYRHPAYVLFTPAMQRGTGAPDS